MNRFEFFRARLYVQWLGVLLAFVLLVCAAGSVVVATMMVRDPESGEMILDPSWLGSWIFFGSLGFLIHSVVTFGVFLTALLRYMDDPKDERLFRLASYLILPVFPAGTIYSIYALSKLAADKTSSASGRAVDH